jgi:hypothetical protein
MVCFAECHRQTISKSIMELTMMVAYNVLRPVAGMCLFIVKKAAVAELLCGGAVPACPEPCT